jgi:hypothetical protein
MSSRNRDSSVICVEFNARLALAEIETKAGRTATGRAHLTVVEADAKGLNLIARKAAKASR